MQYMSEETKDNANMSLEELESFLEDCDKVKRNKYREIYC